MGGGESDRIKPEYEPYTQGYCLVKCECDRLTVPTVLADQVAN